MKYFNSLIFLIFYNALNAQMIKLLPENQHHIVEFGAFVKIFDNQISVLEYNYSEKESLVPGFPYMINEFSKNRNNVELIRKIPEINGDPLVIYSYAPPFFYGNKFVFHNYREIDSMNVIYYYEKKENTFYLLDSIKFSVKNPDLEQQIIHNLAINEDWIVIRKQRFIFDPIFGQTNRIWDYFYRIQNNEIELIDSILFQNINELQYAYKSRVLSQIVDKYCYFSYPDDNSKGQRNGSVTVYKLTNQKWELFQTLYHPEPANGNSYFGSNLAVSKDGRFCAASAKRYQNKYKKAVYLFELINNQYEYKQTIYPDQNVDKDEIALSIDDSKLFIGYSNYSSPVGSIRDSLLFFTNINGVWNLKTKIYPPASDIYCGGFGFSVAHQDETLVIGAARDTTYGLKHYYLENGELAGIGFNGAAYVFQVPARDTLDVSICEGESYWFGQKALTMSGVYRDTLLASYGVDSVVVLNLSVLPPTESGVDTILCPGQKITVGDQTLGAPGFYTIPLKNIYGCDSIVSVSLSYAYLDMEAEISPDFGCRNGKISLLLQGNNPPYSYQWSNGVIYSEKLTDLSPGLYAVTMTDRSGCSFTMNDIEIKEEKIFELPDAFIPTSQMEENQRFRPYLFPGFEETVTITEMEVFNRFGEKVYSGTDPIGWDGTFRGEPAPPGSYLYRIMLTTPCGEEGRKGSLLLVR